MAILLSGCGASTRGAFVGTALVEIAKKIKFNYFVGVSYSSIIGVPLALGMYDEIINKTLNLKHTDFFKVAPMNNKGKFTPQALSRVIGSIFAPNKIKSFGVQDVKPILKEFITEDIFNKYQNGNYPIVYICAVNADTQKPKIWNIKNKSVNYCQYLDIVSASARIPVWTQPQLIDGVEYYDGGVTDTNASTLIIQANKDIKEVYSIYPRPKDFKGKQAPKRKGIVGSIIWTIDTMLKDVSKNDELQERDVCEHKNIKLVQIFPTRYVLSNLYDVDKSKLLELSQMAKNIVNKDIL
jgi:hypothetical protein